MSEHNYASLAFRVNLEKDPDLMTIDLAAIDKAQKERRTQRDAAAPPPGKADLQKEYNQLRQKLFDLNQNAKTFEQRTNDAAGKIHLLEERINDALKLKKAATEAGNLRGERTYEQQVATLETELADTQEEFNKNKRWSGQAARAVKSFDGHARIEELKTLLDAPLPAK